MINRKAVESAHCLKEAVKEVFGTDTYASGRTLILANEAMAGDVARGYDELGRNARAETYSRIVQDFRIRTGCSPNLKGTILEVACGSGLLSLELAAQTDCRIIGIDLSSDMICLANKNLRNKLNEEKPIGGNYCSAEFAVCSVYDISKILYGCGDINYIACRNALHRFRRPIQAIKEMYSALAPGGKIYIRDLKRDADWRTVAKRIGEQRWQKPELVEDYIGAMAAMLTTDELEDILCKSGIQSYGIFRGDYQLSRETVHKIGQMNEYSPDVEYVCVISKPVPA